MPTQEKLNAQGTKYIAGMRATVAELWRKSCEHDKIEPGAKFVVFSKENPYQVFYNRALRQLQEAIAEYRAGGYVGLQIQQGSRAR